MVNRLLHENRKTIPKFLSVKKFFKDVSFQILFFYPSKLTCPNGVICIFFVLCNTVKTATNLTLHHMGIFFNYSTYQDKIQTLEGYIFKNMLLPLKKWDGLPVFTQETIYHVRTEMRQSLGQIS